MEPYYFSQLNKQQQKTYTTIKTGLQSLKESFEVPRVEAEELYDIFSKIRLDCPEIFYVSSYKYSFFQDSSQYKMKPVYLFDKNKIKEHQKAMNARVEKLCRPMQGKKDLEKELYIHDFITANVSYDKLKKQYSHEIIGPMGQGVGVCEGIAKSVKIMCDRLQMPCIVVISHNNPEKNKKYRHAWNIIKIDGHWYHLDATFDNTLGDEESRYDYFNLDDKAVFKDHEPLVYKAPACTIGDVFYYRQKKLSFTKMEDVEKRSIQAAKRGKTLTFHWRGGFLTRAVMEEILNVISETAKSKNKHCQIMVNWPQAIIRVRFIPEQQPEIVKMEDAYSEENE